MKIKIILFGLMMVSVMAFGQFDGVVGSEGCKAIRYDSERFVGWATGCQVTRGYQNIAQPEKGLVSYGTEEEAVGIITDSATVNVVSLGDGGVAVLTFPSPIVNGEGYDFAVFENALNDVFLELAFVEVSSDGEHYYRFPATSNTDTNNQVNGFGQIDATKINNLAGKYRAGWGTPFDLEELLPADANLDVNNIQYVRIIDVIGSIDPQYASRDINGNMINDPYPTDFASGGFDLSGVGVIHNQASSSIHEPMTIDIAVYPNPCKDVVNICANNCYVSLYNVQGQRLQERILNEEPVEISMSTCPRGVYFFVIQGERDKKSVKVTKF